MCTPSMDLGSVINCARVTDLEMTMKRKFRNNGNNLITATRPQYIKTKGTVEEESRIIKGNSFKKSINLYFRKRGR